MSSLQDVSVATKQSGIDKICADLDKVNVGVGAAKPRNKDLKKTKMCVYHLQGRCGYGSSCQFAHCASEIQKAPNLAKTQLCTKFMNGTCTNKNCTYAHGQAELVMPPSYKKKACTWFMQGKCRNGIKCGFAHDISELRAEASPDNHPDEFIKTTTSEASVSPPPGLSLIGSEDECDSSTDVPSPGSQSECDFVTTAGLKPDPLKQQVAAMGSAIEDLQAKLARIEQMAAQAQVVEMQKTIEHLTEQCSHMEAHLSKPMHSAPTSVPHLWRASSPIETSDGEICSVASTPPWRKGRVNAPAITFKPFQ
jgi:hypothetical protein